MSIWLTSDLHLGHNRDFCWEPRGFNSVWEMNEAIVKNWNSIVQPEDDVYVLGDLMLNDNEEGIRLIKQLKGNIHVILGNHDTTERIKLYNDCYNIVDVSFADRIKYKKWHFFLTHYPCITSNFDDGKKPGQRMWSLCGHSHIKNKFEEMDKGMPCYHVELDAHNNFPVLLDNIIEDIKKYLSEKGDI